MKLRNLSASIILISLCCGCSNQQVYDSVQNNRKFNCLKAPISEYEECIQQYEMSYAEYEAEREKLLSDNNP